MSRIFERSFHWYLFHQMLYIDLSGEFYDTVFLLNDSYDFYENEEIYKNFIGLFNKYYHSKSLIVK